MTVKSSSAHLKKKKKESIRSFGVLVTELQDFPFLCEIIHCAACKPVCVFDCSHVANNMPFP